MQNIVTADFFDSVLCRAWERTRYPRDNPKSISVTEVTQCLRLSYFNRKMPKCVPQVISLLLGIEGHKVMADILSEYGWITEKLVCKDYDGIRLCGRVDAWHPDLNIVAEFKFTEKSPSEPYNDHKFQVSIYMNMLNVKNGVIVYFSRDPMNRTKIFWVNRRRRDLDKALERAKLLSEALIRDEVPEAEPSRICRWCPYRFECYQLRKSGKRLNIS